MSAAYITEHGKPVVTLFGRDANRKLHRIKVYGFSPYFYGVVEKSDLKDILGRPIQKVVVNHPRDVPHRARMFEATCEAKIPFEIRYLIDAGIYCGFEVSNGKITPCESLGVPPRICYLDFEMLSPPEILPRAEEPDYPIVNAGFMDSYTKEHFLLFLSKPGADLDAYMRVESKEDLPKFRQYVKDRLSGKSDLWHPYYDLVYFKTEKLLWQGMVIVIQEIDPDVLAGWWSNNFDLPYWIRRCKEHAFPIDRISPVHKVAAPYDEVRKRWKTPIVRGRQCCDLLEFYKVLTKPEGEKFSYDLKVIVKDECGFSYEDLGDRIDEFFNGGGKTQSGLTGHAALVEYGRNELKALYLIDKERGIIEEFDRRRRIFGSMLQDTHIALRNHIAFLHRVAPAPLPTFEFDREAKLKGALVGDVKPGLYEMVGVFDIHSLYPNIIVGKNLSFETKVKTDDGIVWKREPEGFLRKAILSLMEERQKIKAKRKELDPTSDEYRKLWAQEQSFKYAIRSFWGVMKHLDVDIAREITKTARQILTTLIERTRKAGYEVIYWDTDSEFIPLKTTDWREGRKIEALANSLLAEISYEAGLDRELSLEYEKCFDVVFLQTKKHYYGHLIMKDGKEVDMFEKKGVAARRSDSARVTVRLFDEFFDAITRQRSIRLALDRLQKLVDEFPKLPLSEIAIPKGLSRDIELYDKENPWIRGVKNGRKLFKFKFREDKKPLLVYCKSPVEEICFPDYETADKYRDRVSVDYQKMIEKTIRKKIEPFLTPLGLSWSSLFDKKIQSGLERWL